MVLPRPLEKAVAMANMAPMMVGMVGMVRRAFNVVRFGLYMRPR